MCTVSKHTSSNLCQDMCSSHDNDHYNPHSTDMDVSLSVPDKN